MSVIFNNGIKIKLFLAFLFFYSSLSLPQQKTNLEIFYSLADSAAGEFISSIPASVTAVDLELSSGSVYSVFNSRIISSLNKQGIKTSGEDNLLKTIFVVDNAATVYSEIFRNGFLGEYYLTRNLSLSGNFIAAGNDSVNHFSISYSDSIPVSEIKTVENISFPFTQSEIPEEPFFTGLFEPVVAIGTAAAAVILFFTVRSK